MARITGPYPHPVDRHVGQAIRARRKALGLGQVELGIQLGISFQQVQKYEQGINRVSASTLHGLAIALEASVASFFAGLETPNGDGDPARDLVAEMLAAPGGGDMAAAWLAIAPGPRAKLTAVALAFGAA
jgi:transcriptional regulator with XRE-family HTH domain